MKPLKATDTNSTNTVENNQEYFSVSLPSSLIVKRTQMLHAKWSKHWSRRSLV